MKYNKYKNMDVADLNLAIEDTINNSIEADFNAGTGDEDFYSMILQELLDSYSIKGTFKFHSIGDRTTLYLNNRKWYAHYSTNCDDYRIGHIVRHIELLDRLEIIEPLKNMVQDINGVTLFNLEDLKLNPTYWDKILK